MLNNGMNNKPIAIEIGYISPPISDWSTTFYMINNQYYRVYTLGSETFTQQVTKASVAHELLCAPHAWAFSNNWTLVESLLY